MEKCRTLVPQIVSDGVIIILGRAGGHLKVRHESVAIVEYRGDINDFIRVVVNQVAKIAKVTINIENQGVQSRPLYFASSYSTCLKPSASATCAA